MYSKSGIRARSRRFLWFLLATLGALAIIVSRRPDVLLEPEFWASQPHESLEGFDVSMLLLAGLSGPLSILLAPLAVARWWEARVRQGVKAVLEEVLDEEMTEHLKAGYRELTLTRRGERNGRYVCNLVISAGKIERLEVPGNLEGEFVTEVCRSVTSA